MKPPKKDITPQIKMIKRNEIDKHLVNLNIILVNSNATPIRCRGSIGYMCCYCDNQYPEGPDLKRHVIESHEDKTKSACINKQIMRKYVIRLDITHLRCNVCGESIDKLEDLVEHLSTTHDKTFHTDIKNHILPFKFDTETLNCAICNNEFNNFKILVEHMNGHYRNHVCEVCGSGFVNVRKLQTHSYRHKTGVFNCTLCDKTFDTKVKVADHERCVHIQQHLRYKCGYCGDKFNDYAKKHGHEVKMHGIKPVVLKCQACEKTFDNQRALTTHTRVYHTTKK